MPAMRARIWRLCGSGVVSRNLQILVTLAVRVSLSDGERGWQRRQGRNPACSAAAQLT